MPGQERVGRQRYDVVGDPAQEGDLQGVSDIVELTPGEQAVLVEIDHLWGS